MVQISDQTRNPDAQTFYLKSMSFDLKFVEAVIFDMDGVICHTNPYHAEAFRIFFNKRNIATSEQDFVDHLYGKANSYIFRHFLKDKYRELDFEALEEEKEGMFRKIYADKIIPLPGFMELLSGIKKHKLKSGVATSAPRANLELIMNHLNLHQSMDSHLASEDISNHKPHPEIYLRTASILNVDPQKCLVFEDSFSGISSAKNAGMPVIGVLSTHSEEELPECIMYVEDFKDLSQMFS